MPRQRRDRGQSCLLGGDDEEEEDWREVWRTTLVWWKAKSRTVDVDVLQYNLRHSIPLFTHTLPLLPLCSSLYYALLRRRHLSSLLSASYSTKFSPMSR